MDELPREAKLVYVRPPSQVPMGVAMYHQRRLALLDWADRSGAAVIEDDRDGEFSNGRTSLATLQSLDTAGRVLFVGSLTRMMHPILRLGFLVAPSTLLKALRKAKYVTNWDSDLPTQIAAEKIHRRRRPFTSRHSDA